MVEQLALLVIVIQDPLLKKHLFVGVIVHESALAS